MKTALPGMLLRLACLAALALAPAVSSLAAEDVASVIARARAFIGTEAALNAVQSLHFRGEVTSDEGKTHQIEIIMRRPMQQLMIETSDKVRAVTALDDYTMWRRMDPVDGPGTGRVQMMNAQGVRFTRANVGQTLFYYRGLESIGGTVVVEAEEDVEGTTCVRTIFTHPGDIRYIRLFDKATGKLVVTRSDGGTETRESGEIVVAGIRFPEELTTTIAGKSSRIKFNDIRVNEEFDLAMFRLPRPTLDLIAPPRTEAPGAAIPAATSP